MRLRFRCAGSIAALAVLLLTSAGLSTARAEPAGSFTPEQRGQIEAIVHSYLVKHPDVVLDALRALQEQQQSEQVEQDRALLKDNRAALDHDGLSFAVGPADAKVSVVEFFDYRCGFCKRMMPDVMRLISDKPHTRLVLKEFPVLGPESVTASRAALAVLRQAPDKYLAFHKALLSEHGALTDQRIFAIAGKLGLDVTKLRAGMDDPKITAQIASNRALAERLHIEGTPSFVIGDTIVPGAVEYSNLTALIDQATETCTSC
jgi:protein-disulfide isomerase